MALGQGEHLMLILLWEQIKQALLEQSVLQNGVKICKHKQMKKWYKELLPVKFSIKIFKVYLLLQQRI